MIKLLKVEDFIVPESMNDCVAKKVQSKHSIKYVDMLIMLRRFINLNIKSVLEIGTSEGATAQFILNNIPTMELWLGIDLVNNPKGGIRCKKEQRYWYLGVEDAFDSETRLIALNLKFDCVFIDAEHTYEAVKQNTKYGIRFLKQKGLLVWHDYYGVKKFLDELAETQDIAVVGDLAFNEY